MMIIIKSLLIGFILLMLVSCGDTINPADTEFPEKNVSYLYHVEPFMKANCAFSGCHGINAKIELSDYFHLLSATGFVKPGNPDGSLIIQILEQKLPHPAQYPIYFNQIKENQVEGMRIWVKEGALNN